MAINVKEYSESFAYDISKNVLSKGEIHDTDVLSQSIEMILTTMFSERLFNPNFGTPLAGYLFEFIDEGSGEQILDKVIEAIGRWEDRVTVITNSATLTILDDDHSIILDIPYVIKRSGTTSTFKKKILF